MHAPLVVSLYLYRTGYRVQVQVTSTSTSMHACLLVHYEYGVMLCINIVITTGTFTFIDILRQILMTFRADLFLTFSTVIFLGLNLPKYTHSVVQIINDATKKQFKIRIKIINKTLLETSTIEKNCESFAFF